jgi:hypothetical protein
MSVFAFFSTASVLGVVSGLVIALVVFLWRVLTGREP